MFNIFKIARNIRLGIKNLMLHKLRSLLTMLGVVFGVGAVVAMLAVGEGASRQALAQIKKLGSQNIIIRTVKPVNQSNKNSQHSFISIFGLKYADNKRLATTLPNVISTVPAKMIRKKTRLANRTMTLRVVGTIPDWFKLVNRPLLAGRTLSAQDQKHKAAVCVLTENGARKLLATRNTIGQRIKVDQDYFEVVGIVKAAHAGSAIQTPDKNTDVYIPLSTARSYFGDLDVQRSSGSRSAEQVELNYIIAKINSIANVESASTAIKSMLKHFHKVKDYDVDVPLALLHRVQAEEHRKVMTLAWIAAVSLLVGGIGIMNIMLASVTERTREIGIRRAIGARKAQIIGQFLIETVVLSTAGGITGLVIGIGLPYLAYLFVGMPVYVTTWSVVLSLAISVGVGIAFGIYPAMRAADLDPIIALRHE